MRSSHSLDRLDTAFDDDRSVADAGLLLPATLALGDRLCRGPHPAPVDPDPRLTTHSQLAAASGLAGACEEIGSSQSATSHEARPTALRPAFAQVRVRSRAETESIISSGPSPSRHRPLIGGSGLSRLGATLGLFHLRHFRLRNRHETTGQIPEPLERGGVGFG